MEPIDDRTLKNLFARDDSAPASFLGVVLGLAAKLVQSGHLPPEVVAEESGCFALVRVGGPDVPRVLRPGGVLVVGSATGGGSALWQIENDPWISKRHFRLQIGASGIPVVEDLGSKNGTFLNDVRIHVATPLVRATCLRAGHTSFLLF